MVFALESEPERLDPLTIKNPQTFRVAWQMYEGLLGLDANGQIVPRLAESWHTADYRIWTFKLRNNVQFHRSPLFGAAGVRAVTADDVVWSYTAFCAPGSYASFVLLDSVKGCADYNAGKAQSVAGVRALDAATVQLELVRPESFFLNRISSPWIAVFPKEGKTDAFKDRWGLDIVAGTGPFRLVSRSDTEIMLERNPDYWDKARVPTVSGLLFRVIKNPQARLAELEKGTVDIMPLPSELYSAVLKGNNELRGELSDRFVLDVYRTFNHHLIGFNRERVPNIHLRRAIAYAINRAEIVRTLLFGFADVISGPVPPAMRGYAQIPDALGFESARARQELAESGYQGESIDLYVHDIANSEKVGAIVQQQLKDVGINVKLTKLDYGALVGRAIQGEASMFNMFAEIVFSSPEPLLLNLFSSQKIPVPNFWRYQNPEVDTALESLRGIADESVRLVKSAAIEREIIQNVPAVFLYSERHVLLRSRRVTSVVVNGNEHFQLEQVRLGQ